MINQEKVYTYFARYHGPLTLSTNGWYSCTCPFCGRPKFAVHFDFLVAKCWRGCFKGFVEDMIQSYHGLDYNEAKEFIDSMDQRALIVPATIGRLVKSNMILPKGYVPILQGDTILGNRARNYLKNRKFDLNYMDRIGVGYCVEEDKNPDDNYFGYIIIPLKRFGRLVYFIGRDFINNWKRYKNPVKEKFGIGKAEVFFNEEALYLETKIYITEGWACAATLGSQGISVQGTVPSTTQRNIILRSDVEEIIIIPDAGFYRKGLETAKYFIDKEKKIKVLNLDVFEKRGIGKDVNEIGAEIVKKVEQNAPYLDREYLLKGFRKYEKPINTH